MSPRDPRLPRRTVLAAGLSVVSGASPRVASARSRRERALVVVVLSGGADGLSLVVPYRDPLYFRARSKTAVAPPGRGVGGALALDDQFALHPRLAPLLPMFERGELAVGVAVGAPEMNRSHASASQALLRTVLRGAPTRASAPSTGQSLRDGEPSDPTTLVDRLRQVGRIVGRDGRPETHVVYSGGWDTHVAQGDRSSGRLAALAFHLGRGLGELRHELGTEIDRATVLVVSEFGRSLRETPMGGTDDGHAGICFLMGGGVRGGRVLGRWPGLDSGALSQGRHVAATTDFTRLFAEATGLAPLETT